MNYFTISNDISKNRLIGCLVSLALFATNIAAQSPSAKEQEFIAEAGSGWWFYIALIVFLGLGGAFYFWRKSRKGEAQPQYNYDNRYANYYNKDSYDVVGVDAEKEMEWLRKAKKSAAKPPKLTFGPKKEGSTNVNAVPPVKSSNVADLNFDTKVFQEKMRRLQYSQLPINSFGKLSASKLYEPLPVSDDPSVLNAIEQANEEYEEDESVRELAVRILTAFRTRNSVESLSQIALYDLSSNLRSKAVSTLTDFDHESVFEAILLACADPTREVRAAAARGLFRLNFDRSDAWKRIIETNDEFRMSHAGRAAIESGIVVKSFDRLVHDDLKVAYEAFALVSLLIKSGETAEIFNAIKTHKDERVKFALLHVLKVQKDERTLPELKDLAKDNAVPKDVADRVQDAVNSFETVMAY